MGTSLRLDNSTLFYYKIVVPYEGQLQEYLVIYINRNTKDFEQNYKSIERELACMVWAVTQAL